MTIHAHTEFVPGCYRCDLNRDEVRRAFRDDEYRIVYERVADDGAIELYDAHNDLIGWHRNDVRPFGAGDPPSTRTATRGDVRPLGGADDE